MIEILRDVAPFPQPSPAKNPGGDCFACALTAAVRHFYPEQPIAFEAVWEAFKRETVSGTLALSNTWPTMYYAACRLGGIYSFEVRHDLCLPEPEIRTWSHAFGLEIPPYDWAYRLEAWLSAGWLALAEMNYAGAGPVNADGTRNFTDHFVLLDGQRHYWKPNPNFPGSSSLEHDTHVVCSAKGAYWIDSTQLLRRHGVAGLTLIRRDRRHG